jgi:hypothetical protein
MDIPPTVADTLKDVSTSSVVVNSYPRVNSSYAGYYLGSARMPYTPIDFTVDLATTMDTKGDFIEIVTKIIIESLESIEENIKNTLKVHIKENIACNIRPSIMESMKECGINIQLAALDGSNMFRVSPIGEMGEFYYFDIGNKSAEDLVNSTDMNTFLWYVIHYGKQTWRPSQNLATIDFIEKGSGIDCNGEPINDNYVNLKIVPEYQGSLTDFNSDFLDSIKLFDTSVIARMVMERTFNIAQLVTSTRTREEIELEIIINETIERVANSTETETEDSTYFQFSETEYTDISRKAELKKNGKFQYSEDEGITAEVSSEDVTKALFGMDEATGMTEKKELFVAAFNTITDDIVKNNSQMTEKDKFTFKSNLIVDMIGELTLIITGIIISPKVYLLFLINIKLIGGDINTDQLTFIQNNIRLVTDILKDIQDYILDIVVEKILKMSNDLAVKLAGKLVQDQTNKFKQILASLMPPEVSSVAGTFK